LAGVLADAHLAAVARRVGPPGLLVDRVADRLPPEAALVAGTTGRRHLGRGAPADVPPVVVGGAGGDLGAVEGDEPVRLLAHQNGVTGAVADVGELRLAVGVQHAAAAHDAAGAAILRPGDGRPDAVLGEPGNQAVDRASEARVAGRHDPAAFLRPAPQR